MADRSKHARAVGALALMKARYIVETEEWKVQPVSKASSNETIFANGVSAVKTGDLAAAGQMETMLAAKAGVSSGPAPGAHTDHTPAPAAPTPAGGDSGKSARVLHRELQAMIAQARGQQEQAVTLLKEAVQIEESMRPPNGAADPVKPAHELLGEVLLQAGRPAEAAQAFDACLLRMPNRARSLMGAARAHAAAGRADLAAERATLLRTFWKGTPFAAPTTARR
jgi:hypothetical protein